jgi:hypothetical protein
MEKPLINAFIYRKSIKYGHKYYYVDFITEKKTELSVDAEWTVQADENVTLANIQKLGKDQYLIKPIMTYTLYMMNKPIGAHELTLDELVISAYKAAQTYLETSHLSEDSTI